MNWLSQLNPGDWALLIGLLSNAAATVYGMSRINRRVHTNAVSIQKIIVATDVKDILEKIDLSQEDDKKESSQM